MSKSNNEFDAQDLEPRSVDRGIFNEKSLGLSAGVGDWQKSPAGVAYLAGNHGNTIVGPTQDRMSPSEYRERYGT